MTSTSSKALWGARKAPQIAEIRGYIEKVQSFCTVNFAIYELDRANSNKRCARALRPSHLARKIVAFFIWCTQHQNHAIQADVLMWVTRGCQLLSALYSASLLLRSGTTWLRFTATLDNVRQLREEMLESGYEFPRKKDEDLETWDAWLERAKNRRKPERCNNNRYQMIIHTPEREVKRWTEDLFEREHLVLELDMFHGKALMHKLDVKPVDLKPPEGDAPVETGKQLNLEDKSLRGVCENAAAISVATLQKIQHKRIVELVLAGTSHIKTWRV